jgi:hypothetical protein
MQQQSMQSRMEGKFTTSFMFTDIKEFLLLCGPMNDIDGAKSLLPLIMNTLRNIGVRTDGSIPSIADITPRGYKLNALEWASRRGNYEIAEWLATDPRTKIMLTRTDSAPVAWACYTNRVELARMLIKHGADSRSTTEMVFNYKPPLHLVAEAGQLLAAKFLVEECGHDINNTFDTLGQDVRASLRRYNTWWEDNPGCVAVDDYAKSKGVEGQILRMSKTKMEKVESTSKKNMIRQKQKQDESAFDGATRRGIETIGDCWWKRG